jgi:hypothetical protein
VDVDDQQEAKASSRFKESIFVNGDILTSRKGVVSDAGVGSTLNLLSPDVVKQFLLASLQSAVNASSGGISHVFTFVGLDASHEELGLRSSSFYYIPWNETNKQGMDASAIQDFYRNTLWLGWIRTFEIYLQGLSLHLQKIQSTAQQQSCLESPQE